MAGLGETTAALARLRQGARDPSKGPGQADRLKEVRDFGPNPGQLDMLLHAPTGLARGRPLVVVLHGCTQTAEGYADGAGWLTLADRFGFGVVCPQQRSSNNPNLCFNWFEPDDIRRGQGEAASIRSMVEAAAAQLHCDRSRIFVTGLSAGGAMTSVMLAAYPEVFAGGGIIAGLPYGVAKGMPQAFAAMFQDAVPPRSGLGDLVRDASPHGGPWPRVSVWHGLADTTVKASNADGVIAQWADVHGLGASPTRSHVINGRRHDLWIRDGLPVLESHRIAGLGHGAPVAAKDPQGAGRAGPFLLETGTSSSLELLKFWGVLAGDNAARARDTEAGVALPVIAITRLKEQPDRLAAGHGPREARTSGVAAVINKALRAAGLL